MTSNEDVSKECGTRVPRAVNVPKNTTKKRSMLIIKPLMKLLNLKNFFLKVTN